MFHGFTYFLGGVGLGLVCVIYSQQIVKMFGRMGWAEQRFGPGGTVTAWKLIGFIMIVVGINALT